MKSYPILLIAAVSLMTVAARADTFAINANEKALVPFSLTHDAGVGSEVFVVGNHPDLGEWNPVRARKLRWTPGNTWTGTIAINAGNDIEYKYIIRTNTGAAYCSADNTTWMPGDNLHLRTAERPGAPQEGKTIHYYSSWTNAFLLYRSGSNTNWSNIQMEQIGPGREAGEYLYRIEGFARAGERLIFVPNGHLDGSQFWDNWKPGENYETELDFFLLQDGHIYTYWPPRNRTPSAITTHHITSGYAPDVPSRDIRVYTPRNYAQQTTKRYPVLYMHDGQNVYRPGGSFGCWYAEDAADDMISLGLMRETIIVAVDNTDKRLAEYLPPTDTYQETGTADQYLAFLARNVKPFVDAHYRTLTDSRDTGVIGSSFGGVASLYCGLASNIFGKIGPMSTSFWAIPNFVEQYIEGRDTTGLRIYTDFGTEEGESSFQGMWSACNKFMADGYALNDTLLVQIGCGHPHSEWTWAARLPTALRFLFNARDEANEIALRRKPPRLSMRVENGSALIAYTGLKGWDYILQRTASLLAANWTHVATGRTDNLMWDENLLADDITGNTIQFYRIVTQPAPE